TNPPVMPTARASKTSSTVIIASSSTDKAKGPARGRFGHLLGDGVQTLWKGERYLGGLARRLAVGSRKSLLTVVKLSCPNWWNPKISRIHNVRLQEGRCKAFPAYSGSSASGSA